MNDPVYDGNRPVQLVALLRQLAARIQQLTGDDDLLAAGPELLKMMGDARDELFQYEVRITYDSPEVAKSRRIVDVAKRQAEQLDIGGSEEASEWQDS